MIATLLNAPGCHLCHDMAEVAGPVFAAFGVELREQDVHADSETLRAYRYEIPVLLLDGVEIARHRITAADLRARLEARGLRLV